jgi:hypothetical protein
MWLFRYWRYRKETGILEFKSNEMSKIREKSNENERIIVFGSGAGKEGIFWVRRKKNNGKIIKIGQ